MRRLAGIITFTSIALLVGTVGFWGAQRRINSSQASVPSVTVSALSPSEAVAMPSAMTWLRGVIEPVLALRMMQRTVVATAADTVSIENPLVALLTSDLSLMGLGPIELGMSLEDAAVVGLELIPVESNSRGNCRYYRAKSNPEPIGFMVVDDQIIRIDIWPGSFTQTLSGVGIGSSEQAIYAAYPEQIEVSPNPATGGHSLTLVPDDQSGLYRIVFETDTSGKVVQYQVGQFPAVSWPGGCL